MTDSAPVPAPPKANSEELNTLTKVLIVIGAVFVLFVGGRAAWFWYVESVDGETVADLGENPVDAVAAGPEATASANAGAVAAAAADETPDTFGRSTLDDVDDWVFRYPGADYAGGNVVVDTDGLAAGAFVLLTDDPGADVFDYYAEQLRAAGYEVTSQTTGEGIGGGSSGVLMGRLGSPGRTFNVIVSIQEGRTHINTQFQDRR